MKIIHCADLHLDAKLYTHLDRARAKRRRDELLHNFERLADHAAENGVEIILISGDLFDRDNVSALARNMVLSVITAHPEIHFYYLRGNHDLGDCLGTGASAGPPNLFLFGDRWRTYREGREKRIAIAGIELTRENEAEAPGTLRLDRDLLNIVMLHGQETGGGNAGRIDLRALRGRGIDYLALGHIHVCKKAPLDSRGIYCYPGCLEGRGFDECGPHGFALLEIDETTLAAKHRFVPFAQRTLYALDVDVSGCRSTAQMNELVRDAVLTAGCRDRDMADVRIFGEIDVDCEKDVEYIRRDLQESLFFARLRDETVLYFEPEEYLYDESLRGEFVRTVMADPDIPEEEKADVIRWGFRAMDGEDLL